MEGRARNDETVESDAELARARRELAESESRFADVFRHAPDVMSIVRVADAVMFEVNDAFVRVSGVPREAIIGKSSYDFPWWPSPEVRDRVLGKLRDQGFLQDEEVRFSAVNENVSVISASPFMYRGERCVVWRATDITAQRRAEHEKRELEARLREKQNLERLGLLAGGIAHEFNNLLVGVMGNADLLLNIAGESSPYAALLHTMLASTQRMSEHTRELLDYAGHTPLKLAPLQLGRLLDELSAAASPQLTSSQTLRVVRAPGEPCWVRGDADQLTRLFLNLIKNAAAAMDGEPGEISLSLTSDSDQIEVLVRDSGHGMDEVTRANLFDPFRSTKLKGYGLGLASALSVVERHGGSIAVDSAPGQGTSVRVRLPRHAPSPGEVAARPAAPTRGKGRVLVVDDEHEVRRVARAMLSRLGFEALEADNGTRALELVAREPHGCVLVLLDATMPGLNGAQTFERLRDINRELPVLFCSGYSHADFSELLAEQPRTSFLTKPFRTEQLASAIATLLEPEAPTQH